MGKTAFQKAHADLTYNHAQVKTKINALWGKARNAPMYRGEVDVPEYEIVQGPQGSIKKKTGKLRKVIKGTRLIKPTAFHTILAGARSTSRPLSPAPAA